MYDELTKEEIEQTKRNFRIARRFVRKYLTLLLFSLYIYWMPILATKDPVLGFRVTKGFVIAGAIVTIFLFYSLTRVITVYNSDATDEFINSETPIKTFKEKLGFIFGRNENKLEIVLATLIYLILPFGATSPCFEWLFIGENGGFVAKAIFTIGMLSGSLIVYVLAHLSAIKFWDSKERKRQADISVMSKGEQKLLNKADKRSYRNMFLLLLVGYFVGSAGLLFFIPALLMMLLPFFLLMVQPEVYITAIVLILFPAVFRHVRAMSKRRKFIKELTQLCKTKKYRLSRIKSPYKSIFRPCLGENFKVSIRDKTYSCKLIASKRRGRPLYIMKNGIGGWLVQWKFISIELLSYTKTFEFGWESNYKKIIIVNPVPQKVLTPKGGSAIPEENTDYYISPKKGGLKPLIMKTTNKEYAVELDNCDIVDGYEFYTATGFINALDRDIIDKDL